MTTLEAIRPDEPRRVMDLLRDAGFDVSDWSNYALGATAPAANPRYCYEWGFLQEGHGLLLLLWFDRLRIDGARIYQELNYRSFAAKVRGAGANGAVAARSRRTDDLVRQAYRVGLPVRVVICSRPADEATEGGFERSSATERMLDVEPWFIRVYDDATGAAVVERGEPAAGFADQFELRSAAGASEEPAQRRAAESWKYARSAAVRATALQRARGRCELCGAPGFELGDGRLYLETHHVVPLSEGGPDTPTNVVALCANHHREAHHGAGARTMREQLLDRRFVPPGNV